MHDQKGQRSPNEIQRHWAVTGVSTVGCSCGGRTATWLHRVASRHPETNQPSPPSPPKKKTKKIKKANKQRKNTAHNQAFTSLTRLIVSAPSSPGQDQKPSLAVSREGSRNEGSILQKQALRSPLHVELQHKDSGTEHELGGLHRSFKRPETWLVQLDTPKSAACRSQQPEAPKVSPRLTRHDGPQPQIP